MASALAHSEVAEVLVVDDASGDDTLDAAARADDGSGRLKLLKQEENRGPSAARNRAIKDSTSPIIALLDSDDRFLPGRFAALNLISSEWDFVADNIMFAESGDVFEQAAPIDIAVAPVTRAVGLVEFAERNISKRGAHRSELGFLKPLMKRKFLEDHALSYDENLRLGEDFILYARALAKGARFLLAEPCGYGAIERADSLSGHHSAEDLAALAAASRKIATELPAGAERKMMGKHAAALDIKVAHRRFLDRKREHGIAEAVSHAMRSRAGIAEVGRNIFLDKIAPAQPTSLPRMLFDREEFERP